MTPPQLSGDTPVFNVFQPLKIGFLPILWHETDLAGTYGVDGWLGYQCLATGQPVCGCVTCQINKPLICQIRLNYGSATVPSRYFKRMVLRLFK